MGRGDRLLTISVSCLTMLGLDRQAGREEGLSGAITPGTGTSIDPSTAGAAAIGNRAAYGIIICCAIQRCNLVGMNAEGPRCPS